MSHIADSLNNDWESSRIGTDVPSQKVGMGGSPRAEPGDLRPGDLGPGDLGPGDLGEVAGEDAGAEGTPGRASSEESDRAQRVRSGDCCSGEVPGGSQSVDNECNSCSAERRFATCTRAAKDVLDELLQRLTELEWGEDDRFGVHLAVEEALMNAIKHGNGLDAAKEVQVRTELSERRFWIQITDEGSGFNPEDVPDPTLDENLELPSGRGLMLMRTFMARVEFNERGNEVTMEKHRDSPIELDGAVGREEWSEE